VVLQGSMKENTTVQILHLHLEVSIFNFTVAL
jgi:hypothetical protein